MLILSESLGILNSGRFCLKRYGGSQSRYRLGGQARIFEMRRGKKSQDRILFVRINLDFRSVFLSVQREVRDLSAASQVQ
jgi:hypothetical protein